MALFIRATSALAWREVVRFYRQPGRIIGALATPIVFWLFAGAGLGRSFSAPGVAGGGEYLSYLFPGTVALSVMFTAIFSTISIIDDRKEGFLQSALVAPVPRSALVLSKVVAGAALGLMQAWMIMLAAPALGVRWTPQAAAEACAAIALMGGALTGLGFMLAWYTESVQSYHGAMNVVLMPLWVLSGALFPGEYAAPAFRAVIRFNPLTASMSLLRHALFAGAPAGVHFGTWLIAAGFFAVTLIGAFSVAQRPSRAAD